MIAQRFLTWCETASVAERCKTVTMLAQSIEDAVFCGPALDEANAALLLATEDPSPRVRSALAGMVASSARVQPLLLSALARDIDPVAEQVVRRSRRLDDDELVDLLASGSVRIQAAIAARARLTPGLMEAISELGAIEACLELLDNAAVDLPPTVLHRICVRFRSEPAMRRKLSEREGLGVPTRQLLVEAVGAALVATPLLSSVFGAARTCEIVRAAEDRALEALSDEAGTTALVSLVARLHETQRLTPAFLLRTVCAGRLELFAAALAALGPVPTKRVRSVLVDARGTAVVAMLERCGVEPSAARLMHAALGVWRQAARDSRDASASEVAATAVSRVLELSRRDAMGTADRQTQALLRRLSNDMQMRIVRERAERRLAA